MFQKSAVRLPSAGKMVGTASPASAQEPERALPYSPMEKRQLARMQASAGSLAYDLAVTLLAIGSGTLTLLVLNDLEVKFNVLGASYPGVTVMVLPPGAFIALGILIALRNKIQDRMDAKQ